MPSFRSTRQVRHAPDQMFDLVADVERYPEFLPLCEALRVRRRAVNQEGIETLVAEMRVGYKAMNEAFTSRVTLDRPGLRILVEYVDGPFSFLENHWSFRPDPMGAAVEFAISYEFKSVALRLLMGAVFDRAFRRFAQAFEQRADEIYGRQAASIA